MYTIKKYLKEKLDIRKRDNCLRILSPTNKLIDFCSNDYLGFARSNELEKKIATYSISDIQKLTGSTGSRLLTGNSDFAEQLEDFIADYHKAEAGLIFNSGYDANIGLFSSILKKGTTIISDELIHASIRDGIRLSYADAIFFQHNDLTHLEDRLKKADKLKFVVLESVYSMDGDFAPLIEAVDLCEKYDAYLIVDEAHATGLFGERGEGRVVELGLEKKVFARIHTFGKALGCHGAIVLGNHILRNYLINFARSFIYTTALPIHTLIAIKCAYEILLHTNNKTINIKELISLFKQKIKKVKNLHIIESHTPIQSIIIKGNSKVRKMAEHIQEAGYDVRPIMSPTVPKEKERLRICLHIFNTDKEVEELVNTIKEIN